MTKLHRRALKAAVAVAFATSALGFVGSASAQTLKVAATALPPPKGNPYAAGIFPSWHTWTALFDAMTVVDPQGNVQPQAASAWQNVDSNTWRFTLRDDVVFDNGEKLDAGAVAAAITWLKSDAGKTTSVGRQVGGVVSATAIDARTVEVKTAAPDAILPARISAVLIVAPKAWADQGAEGYANAPVGSGSFKVESWTPEKVVFSGRKDSWRAPKVSGLEILPLGERPARVQALISDQAHIAVGLSTDNIATVEGGGHRVDVSPSTVAATMAFINTKDGLPFTDVRVRQAFNYAVDKQAIADNLFAGRVKPASQGATPNTFGYNTALAPYPHDPAKARALLAEAGYGNGMNVVAEVVVGSFAADSEMYQQVAQDLSNVGVTMELRPIPSADWIKKFITGTWEGGMFGAGQNSAPINDASRFLTFGSCKKPNPYYCDESVVALLEKSDTLFDPNERRAALGELLKIQHDRAANLFLIEQIDLVGVSRRVQGLVNLGNSFNYEEISLSN